MRAQEEHEEGQVRRQQIRSEVRPEVWPEVRSEVRSSKLIPMARARQSTRPAGDDARAAGLRLLDVYAGLAQRSEHLLDSLLRGQSPKQWTHYPEYDAIDADGSYQWFYHSHSPEDRPGAREHGHIHLFARRRLWSRRLRSRRELAFAQLAGGADARVDTRHLLTIGFDAKGLPISLFTVNSWVTGDLMLSAETTVDLLDHMVLETGNADIDAVIVSLVRLFRTEIRDLLVRRDMTLFGFEGDDVLSDESLEILSELPVDVDSKLV
ncbi:hypothetical protein [Paraburkholderia sp.]|uniref:DUF6969 family protein n=1 Tax=Paraburkholderia sp. TaxID=1926495 RepID=UPI0025D2E41E|nr:hypothetical protein [Paraburkholderia sp.]